MDKKSTLLKKLSSYSAFATAVLALKESDAQIVYHDVNPDFVIPEGNSGHFTFDLNADGVSDYEFTINESSSYSVFVSGLNDTGDYKRVLHGGALFSGELIGSSGVWWNASSLSSTPLWQNVTDGFLGLRLPISGNYYFGWVRLDVKTITNDLVIKDYAIETTPNVSIVAGDKGCNGTPITPVITELPEESLLSSVISGNQWYLNNSALVGETNDTLFQNKTGIIKSVVTDSLGCITASLTFDFERCDSLNNVVTLAGDTSGNNVCSGTQVTLTCQQQLHQNYQIQWYSNDAPIPSAIGKTYSSTLTDSATFYEVISNSLTGCSDTSNIFDINVWALPPSPVITQHFDTLFASGTGDFQWNSYPDSPIPGATDYFYISSTDYYNYSVTATDSNGCKVTSPYFFYNKCTYLTPVLITYGDVGLCIGDSVEFATHPLPNCTYSWYFNSSPMNDFDTSSIAYEVGLYYCQVHDSIWNCTKNTEGAIVTSSLVTAPEIFLSGDSLISTPSYSYEWFLDGNEIPGATSQSFHPDSAGYYSVEITNLYGCFAMSDSFFYANFPTSVENADVNWMNDEKWSGGFLQVFNIFGEELFSGWVESIPLQLNLENLPAGVYYAVIRKEKTFLVSKILNTK